MKRKTVSLILLMAVLAASVCNLSAEGNDSLLEQGLEAYRTEDWSTALFFLRKASTLPENLNAETWYVLIMSEVYAGDYEGVCTDGEYFIKAFPESSCISNVRYQMCRALFCTGAYQKSIESFSSFCTDYPDDSLFSSALFWMAESLYQTFNFKEASSLFERIVTDYPSSPKVTEAAFRLDLLSQREREEKLLYLLRVTGEEYLAAKEDYEKLIKQYQSEEAVTLRKNIREQNAKIDELNEQLKSEVQKNQQLNTRVSDLSKQNESLKSSLDESLRSIEQYEYQLKQAAADVQAAEAAKTKADAEAAAATAAANAANAQAVEARLQAADAATAAANAKAEAATAAADAARKAADQRPVTTIIYQNIPSVEVEKVPEEPVPAVTVDSASAEDDEEYQKLLEKAQRLQALLDARN